MGLFSKRPDPGPPPPWRPAWLTAPPGDWSQVDTVERAEELTRAGLLERFLLVPERFGGQALPPNLVPAPVGILAAVEPVFGAIAQAVEAGKVSSYDATPRYRGTSKVPEAVLFEAGIRGEPPVVRADVRFWAQ